MHGVDATLSTIMRPPPAALTRHDATTTIVQSQGLAFVVDLAELWRYRELLYFLAWRDVKVRYLQAVLGVAWAILQPLTAMVIFAVFFGRLAGFERHTSGVPYPLYVFAGLLPWTMFATAITSSANSLVGNAHLITKVYFPRLVIPLAAVAVSLVDFLCAAVVLVLLMTFYGAAPGWSLLLAPVCIAGVVAAASGLGALLAALTVSYRDFRHAVPFLLQIGMFLTPVVYPAALVPERWWWIVALNPMAGLVEGFRGALFGLTVAWASVGLSLVLAFASVVVGAVYFRSVERRFADIV